MSYQEDKVMDFKHGHRLLEVVDEHKADWIEVVKNGPVSVMTFADGADGMPMAVKIGIEPVQAGTGDPSPSNIRAISGFTGANVLDYGVNIFDETVETAGNGATIVSLSGDTAVVKNPTSSANRHIRFPLISNITRAYVGKRITAKIEWTGNPQTTAGRLVIWGESSSVRSLNITSTGSGWRIYSDVITEEDIGYALCIQFYASDTKNAEVTYKFSSIAFSSEVVPFALYVTPRQKSITFPESAGTVYGGTLEVYKDGSGKLTVDSEYVTITGIDIDKIGDTSIAGLKYVRTNTLSSVSFITCCDSRIIAPDDSVRSVDVVLYTNKRLYFYSELQTDEEIVEYFNANPVHCVVKKSATTQYNLSAEEVGHILSLKGLNNVFADTGDVLSVDYSADTKIYIDSKNDEQDATASATQGMIADSDAVVATENHSSGDVFICNNQLLRATASIAIGDTISTASGGNAEVVKIADLLSQSIESYNYSWHIGPAYGVGTYEVFRFGRLRTLTDSLNPVCFKASFLSEEDRPAQETSLFPVAYSYYQNNSTVKELCYLKYTSSTNTWELIRNDGTTMALGNDVVTPVSSDRITFNIVWYV